jgi:hypothetical protein
MQPVEPEPTHDRGSRVVLTVLIIGVAILGLAVVFRRLRRNVDDGFADLLGEGVREITEAVVDELFAA